MTKKKIILAATTDLNYDQRLIRIASTLVEMGFEVLLIGRNLTSSPPLQARKYKQYRLSCFFQKGFLFYAEYNIRLFFFLLFKKYTFATANDLDTMLGVYFSSFFKKSVLVFDAHELFTEVPELKNTFKKRIWRRIEQTFVPKFDKHYTVCHSLADIFEEKLHRKFTVIRNVPFLQHDIDNITKTEKTILYQGAVNEGRGLKQLILAMQDIEATLLIAGDGDIRDSLKQLVIKTKLEEKVYFLGKLSPKELQTQTQKAYIGVNLLENRSLNYYYSLANKFFDYIQAEIPQVGMDFPEYKSLNEQYKVSLLINDLKTTTIVENINRLLEDDILYQQIKKNTKVAKRDLNWEKERKILKKIYT